MYASCAQCKQPLTRGFFLSVRAFEKLKVGERFEVKEVIACFHCGNIAVKWSDESVVFYEEKQNG